MLNKKEIKKTFVAIRDAIAEHKFVALGYLSKAAQRMESGDSEGVDLYMNLHRSRWKRIHKLERLLPEKAALYLDRPTTVTKMASNGEVARYRIA